MDLLFAFDARETRTIVLPPVPWCLVIVAGSVFEKKPVNKAQYLSFLFDYSH